MAHTLTRLTHTIHHPTQGGEIRVIQEDIWSGTLLSLQADASVPLYGSWTALCDSNTTEADLQGQAQALLRSFISVVYETDWE